MTIIQNSTLTVDPTNPIINGRVDLAQKHTTQYTPNQFLPFDDQRLIATAEPLPGRNLPLPNLNNSNLVPSIMPLSTVRPEATGGILIQGVYLAYLARLMQSPVVVPAGAYALKIKGNLNMTIFDAATPENALLWHFVLHVNGVERLEPGWHNRAEWGDFEDIVYCYAPQEVMVGAGVDFWQLYPNTEGKGIELTYFDFVPVSVSEPNRYFNLATGQFVEGRINPDEPIPDPEPGPDPTPPWLPIALGIGAFALALIVGLVYVIVRLTQVNSQALGGSMLDFLPLDQAGNALIVFVLTVLGVASASPLTDQLVTALKAIEHSVVDLLHLNVELDARWYNLAVSLAITVGGWIGVRYDVLAGVENIFDLLLRALPLAASVLGFFAGHKATYYVAKKLDMPLAGYSRPELPNKPASK